MTEDLTTDRTDEEDAVRIGGLAAPTALLPARTQPVDETWGRLRHSAPRDLLTEHVACVQQIRDLLECVWHRQL